MLRPKLQKTLFTLLEAFEYAEDTESGIWDFAISIQHIDELGVTETDLRWLVKKGIIDHAREITSEGDDGRQFQSTGNLTFYRDTNIVLTSEGVLAARAVVNGYTNQPDSDSPIRTSNTFSNNQIGKKAIPLWQSETRELWVGKVLVKHFKWRAPNQEIILSAFEEEGWPLRIDDPLPQLPELDPKRRLSDTIKCLNRKQVNAVIHFHGDGTGEGVTWERFTVNGSNGKAS